MRKGERWLARVPGDNQTREWKIVSLHNGQVTVERKITSNFLIDVATRTENISDVEWKWRIANAPSTNRTSERES